MPAKRILGEAARLQYKGTFSNQNYLFCRFLGISIPSFKIATYKWVPGTVTAITKDFFVRVLGPFFIKGTGRLV